MSAVTRLAAAIADHGVRLVAVDFDRTIVNVHTKGRWRGSAGALASHVRPFFRKFLLALQRHGLWVCVCTFSVQAELVRNVCCTALGGKVSRVYLRALDGSWVQPSVRTTAKGWQGVDVSIKGGGKLGHMFSTVLDIATRTGEYITPAQTLFLDDDMENIFKAKAAGVISALFPATFEEASADRICQAELEGFFCRGEPFQLMSAEITARNGENGSLPRVCRVS